MVASISPVIVGVACRPPKRVALENDRRARRDAAKSMTAERRLKMDEVLGARQEQQEDRAESEGFGSL